MKKMIFSLAFLFINIVQSSSQNTDTVFTDTIFVSVDELLKNKKNMVELEVKEGQVISFKANKELLTHSRIFFKFWKNQEGIYGLHSKGKIVFGRKSPNENIPIESPVSGILTVKLKRSALTASVIGITVFVLLVKAMRPF